MTTNVTLLNHGRGNEDLNVDVQQRGQMYSDGPGLG